MLLRMLDIKHTGGDVKDVFPCHQQEITVPHTNTDIIDNEDDDVKAERERVKDIFNKNNIRVSISFSWNMGFFQMIMRHCSVHVRFFFSHK